MISPSSVCWTLSYSVFFFSVFASEICLRLKLQHFFVFLLLAAPFRGSSAPVSPFGAIVQHFGFVSADSDSDFIYMSLMLIYWLPSGGKCGATCGFCYFFHLNKIPLLHNSNVSFFIVLTSAPLTRPSTVSCAVAVLLMETCCSWCFWAKTSPRSWQLLASEVVDFDLSTSDTTVLSVLPHPFCMHADILLTAGTSGGGWVYVGGGGCVVCVGGGGGCWLTPEQLYSITTIHRNKQYIVVCCKMVSLYWPLDVTQSLWCDEALVRSSWCYGRSVTMYIWLFLASECFPSVFQPFYEQIEWIN